MKTQLIVLILCYWAYYTQAQPSTQTPSVSSISDRDFFSLQNDYVRLKTDYDRLADQLADKDKEWQSLHEEFKSLKNQINIYINIFLALIGLLGSVTLWQVFRYSEKFLKQRFAKQISSVLDAQRGELLQLVAGQDLENRIRENSRILLLSPNQAESEEILTMLENFGFKKVKPRFFEDAPDPKTEFDLIVLNNPHDEFAQKTLAENPGAKNIIVAYTKNNLTRNDRLNFSNSPMTLYSRIMESLKFKSLG